MTKDMYGLDPQQLEAAAKGYDSALEALGEIGFGHTAAAGRGITNLKVSRADMGHEGMTGALDGFCERWEWGVRALIREGEELRDGLLETKTTYELAEQTANRLLKRAAHDAFGNPMGDSEKAMDRSWKDIGNDAAPASMEENKKAYEEAGENLRTTGRNLAEAGYRYSPAGGFEDADVAKKDAEELFGPAKEPPPQGKKPHEETVDEFLQGRGKA
ncbi:hypothetical protein D5S17_30300 [Pseudonocardiaceae bacterium YIM PH 21723]|nr:hypothetical protein D5S17_30300 [Pseudonocardiaceae bacterium YIM PH 21723]